MPELPEVQTTVAGLNKKVLYRTFIDVWSDWEKTVKKPKNFNDFRRILKGKKIKKIWRRAKNIIFDLSDEYSMLVHQKMTGHLLVGRWIKRRGAWFPEKNGPMEDPYNRFLHVVFFLDDGRMIALSDVRKFAKIELEKTNCLLDEFKKLGPEPLDKKFSLEDFRQILKRRKGKIKQVLMDPYTIAGIGNIYSSEILWWAKVHPEKITQDLTKLEVASIYKCIKKVLRVAVDLGGESFSDYRKVDGRKGDFDSERKVYKRGGQKCSRCRTKIVRKQVGQRSAFFCPTCQKL